MEDVVILYRPTGPQELALVAASGWKRWPPRLSEQPIFYPVTNEAYAREIAERWNVKESGSGFVSASRCGERSSIDTSDRSSARGNTRSTGFRRRSLRR